MSSSRLALDRARDRARERARWFLRMQKVEDRLGDVARRTAALEDAVTSLPSVLAAHHETRLRADHAVAVASGAAHLDETFAATLNRHELRLEYLERLGRVEALDDWIAGIGARGHLRISVVLPTRNRAGLVPRAIATVLAQTYDRWELVAVDDGSDDDTSEVLSSYDDPRIRPVRTTGLGLAGARNTALENATGDVIVYLDDDNLMHPRWLEAVAWAFDRHPDLQVLYAARLIDDEDRLHHRAGRSLPAMHFERFDRQRLHEGNIADVGVVAHRRDHPEAHFDATLDYHEDWDLFLRLTDGTDPLELPALSILYTTEAQGRLTDIVDPDVHHAPPPSRRDPGNP